MSINKNIDCIVHDCKYCDCDSDKCKLTAIKIAHSGKDGLKEHTMCDSYKKKMSK